MFLKSILPNPIAFGVINPTVLVMWRILSAVFLFFPADGVKKESYISLAVIN